MELDRSISCQFEHDQFESILSICQFELTRRKSQKYYCDFKDYLLQVLVLVSLKSLII